MSWRQLEKLAKAYRRKPTPTAAAALDRRQRRASEFTETLTNHFVRNHAALENASVAFRFSTDGVHPDWLANTMSENALELNLVSARIPEECEQALDNATQQEEEISRSTVCMPSWLRCGNCHPSCWFFCCCSMKRSRIPEVTCAERRRGAREAVDLGRGYVHAPTLGFQELESVVRVRTALICAAQSITGLRRTDYRR